MFIVKVLFVSDVVEFTGDFYPEICQHRRFHLLFFMSSYRWVLDHTDQNQYERLVEEVAINQFFVWYRCTCGDDSQFNW